MTFPHVTCVIPVRNGVDSISAAIHSCLDQDYMGGLDVVISDGMSTDGTREIVSRLAERYQEISLVDNPACITPTALNAAIAVAAGQVIVRCDAHAVLPQGYVARAVSQLEEHNAANVGGVQRAAGTTTVQRGIALAMSSAIGVGDARFRIGGRAGPVETVYLGSFDRSAIEDIGLFDETMIRNQDYDLNHRLRKAGYTVWFDPELSVEYTPRPSVGRLGVQYYDYGVGKRRMLRRHPDALRWRQLAPPLLVLALLASVVLAIVGNWAVALITPLLYLAILGVGTLLALRRDRTKAVLVYPLAVAAMHTAWGLGFLVGRSTTQRAR